MNAKCQEPSVTYLTGFKKVQILVRYLALWFILSAKHFMLHSMWYHNVYVCLVMLAYICCVFCCKGGKKKCTAKKRIYRFFYVYNEILVFGKLHVWWVDQCSRCLVCRFRNQNTFIESGCKSGTVIGFKFRWHTVIVWHLTAFKLMPVWWCLGMRVHTKSSIYNAPRNAIIKHKIFNA